MGAKYSVQETNRTTATANTPNAPKDMGKLVVRYFNYVAATFNNGDTLALVQLPNGARFLGGKILTDGLAGSTTQTIGDGTTADKYLGSTSIGASATQTEFGNTLALFYGQLLTAATVITMTLGGANATDGKLVAGEVRTLECV